MNSLILGYKSFSVYDKMAPWGQYSERRLATMSLDNSEANWNRRTGGQEDGRTDRQNHVLSQADALTKNQSIYLGEPS